MVRLLTKFQQNRSKFSGGIDVLDKSWSAVLGPKIAYVWKIVKNQVFEQFANEKGEKAWINLTFKMAISLFQDFDFLDHNFQKLTFFEKKSVQNQIS